MSNGFGKYSNAPPSYAETALPRSECAVMTMTGSAGRASRIFFSSSSPDCPGMRMSVMSTSGDSRRSASSAGSAASNARGAMPPLRKARSSTQRMEASSSTSQTRREERLMSHHSCRITQGQQQRENGPSRLALEFDEPAVTGDEVLCDGEPEARPARPPGDERIENARAQLRRHAGAIVLDLHTRDEAMARGADAHIRQRTCPERDAPTTVAERLHGIARHVEQRLDDLISIQQRARQARVVIAIDDHFRARFRTQQVEHVLAELVHVDRSLDRRPARTRHGIDERGEPIGFRDDDAGVLVQRLALQLLLQQLRRSAQSAERVFDLVRELANH